MTSTRNGPTPERSAIRPVPLPLRLLARLLPPEVREAASGDAIEEFVRRRRTGLWPALAWCWRQSLSPDLVRLRYELRHSRRSGARSQTGKRNPTHAGPPRRPIIAHTGDATMLDTLSRDLTYAARRLARRPGFTGVAVLTLALGIGATSAIFAVVNGVVIRPLPYRAPEHLVSVGHVALSSGDPLQVGLSSGALAVYGESTERLEELGAYFERDLNLTGPERPERVNAALVTGSVLGILGVPAALGRVLNAADDRPEVDTVIVVSHGVWQRLFGGDRSILDRDVLLDGTQVRIVGVMPAGFAFPRQRTDVWVPLQLHPERARNVNFYLQGIARLAPNVTPEQAAAELDALFEVPFERYRHEAVSAAQLREAGFRVTVRPLRDLVVGDVGRILWVLMAAVGLILLIACANVANLFLVQAEGREQELAIQSALGASRHQLVRYFVVETGLLALLGGGLGLALAFGGLRLLLAARPAQLPRVGEIHIDGAVLAFTVVSALASGLLFGVLPALRLRTESGITAALKETGHGVGGARGRHRTRNAIAVAQLALALMLLIGSGLMLRTFWNLRAVDPGLRTTQLLLFEINLPRADYRTSGEGVAFHQSALDQLREIPGVEAATAASYYFGVPIASAANPNPVWVEDEALPADTMPVSRPLRIVLSGFFETLGIPLVAGRGIERRDIDEGTGAAVVSESFARIHWPDEDPIGKRIHPGFAGPVWLTVVGIAKDVRQSSLATPPDPTVYWGVRLPEDNYYTDTHLLTYAIHASGGTASLLPAVREVFRDLDPTLPVANVRSMRDVLAASMERISFTMVMLASAAAVALLLGSIGIYGVMAYAVSQRTREIGLRMALGAHTGSISRLVLGQAGMVVATGLGLGLAGAYGATRLLASLLFGVAAVDPVTYISVSALLATVAGAASYIPARRATRIDPMKALRDG